MQTDGRAKRRVASVTHLRRWLAAGVVLLALVLAGLLGYARYKAHRFLADLPAKLGIDIKSETNSFTYSQTVKGHTIYTLHAAKAIQRENGKTTLHDVAITIYGPVGSHRVDSVKGAEFEYDQSNGVIRAAGEVHLDLASPSEAAAAKPDAKRIAVTTSGLVFLQKLGVAATDQPMQFTYGDISGSAVGADYETDTGVLRLRNAVTADGKQDGRDLHIRAAAAEIDRNTEIATLKQGHVKSDGTSASGDTVVLTLAKGGGVQTVDAQGHAALEAAQGMSAQAPHMHARMAADGKLEQVEMNGGVSLRDARGTGSAKMVTVRFIAGVPLQAMLDGSVQLDQAAADGSTDVLTSAHLVADLTQDATHHTQLKQAVATGNAVARSASPKALPDGRLVTQITTMRAETLHATTAARGMKRYIDAVDGRGLTRVEEDDGAGNLRTSSGDTLDAKLLPPGDVTVPALRGSSAATPKAGVVPSAGTGLATAGKAASATCSARSAIQSGVQNGHVVVTQHTAAVGSKPAQDSRATAAREDFDCVTGRLVLTGSPQVTGPGLQLAADRISMAQVGGNADATGNVSGTYVQVSSNAQANTGGKVSAGQPNASQANVSGQASASSQGSARAGDPVHVLADHATVSDGGSAALFFGTAKVPARMWTSTAQMDAPVIEMDRASGHLLARGATGADRVHLVLPQGSAVSSGGDHTGSAAAAAGARGTAAVRGLPRAGAAKPSGSDVVRVSGGTLLYTPAQGSQAAHADVSGGVRMEMGGSQLQSANAVATLSGAQAPAGAVSGEMLSGRVESLLATGAVRLQQPGRTATGERLLYTAAEDSYNLTGSPAAPPRVSDSLHGTVTGAELRFHGDDGDVEVMGEPGRRVHTETEARPASRGAASGGAGPVGPAPRRR